MVESRATHHDAILELLDAEVVHDIQRVYASVWGRDAVRSKGAPRLGSQVQAADVLDTLAVIARRWGRPLALVLAEAARHSAGVTDAANCMRPVPPDTFLEIAEQWVANRDAIDRSLSSLATRLEPLRDVLAWWWTYLDYIDAAKRLTGRFDAEAFEGVSEETALDSLPGATVNERQEYLTREAHTKFEKADLVAFGLLGRSMRTSWQDVAGLMAGGDWEELLRRVALARLFGDGRFYRTLRVALALAPDDLQRAFTDSADALVAASRAGYRTRQDLSRVDLERVARHLERLCTLSRPVTVPQGFDFDEAWMKARQAPLRVAETHLAAVEAAFATLGPAARGGPAPSRHTDPADAYARSILIFLERLEGASTCDDFPEWLTAFRRDLVRARALADAVPHRFVFWSGAGEGIGQMIDRAHDPRYRLYQMEAYAERVFLAAEETRLSSWSISVPKEEFERHLRGEAALLVQRWIIEYGPRRPTIFGWPAAETIEANAATQARDAWVRMARERLLAMGADPDLWGPLASGYTERLRHLLRDGDAGHSWPGPICLELERLLDLSDARAFARAVRETNPYTRAGDPAATPCPFVTIGVHVHNADVEEVRETLASMREVDWPSDAYWPVVGSTSSDPRTAEREHDLALEYGATRFAMANRQLLKAGNQNRVIPNAPRRRDGESFYLTLDDDSRPAPLTLRRMVPILLRYPRVAFAQAPLYSRACHEIGHTRARRVDAHTLGLWSTFWIPAFNDLSLSGQTSLDASMEWSRAAISFPLGYGTLFRLTPGRCVLDATGGMVVDPRRMLATEDMATGLFSMRMRARPEAFETVGAEWSDGAYLADVWVVSDNVDFFPGHHHQKRRWAEGMTQCLHHYWLRALAALSALPRLDWKVVTGTTVVLSGWWLHVVGGTLSFVVFPAMALHPRVRPMSGHAALLGMLFFYFLPLTLDAYLQRAAAGLTLREVGRRFALTYYGTYVPAVSGVLSACFRKPSQTWASFKRRTTLGKARGMYAAFCLLNLAGATAGILRHEPLFALCFLHALGFLYLQRLCEHAPVSPGAKVRMLARDARITIVERLMARWKSRGSSYPVAQRRARAFWLFWLFGALASFSLDAFKAIFGLTSYLPVVVFAVGILSQSYRVFHRIFTFWIALRSLERAEVEGPRGQEEARRLARAIAHEAENA